MNRFIKAALVLLLLLSALSLFASAAGNNVPTTGLGQATRSVRANDLKPAECNGITLANVFAGSGTVSGGSGNDLILGSSGTDTLNGNPGNDCLLAGDSNDTLNGGTGNDVLIGGGGFLDNFNGGDGTDTCIGNILELFLFASSCENEVQE